jgi:hypothetical protein
MEHRLIDWHYRNKKADQAPLCGAVSRGEDGFKIVSASVGGKSGVTVEIAAHHASRTTHHAPRTTHHAPRTTHHAPRTTHRVSRIAARRDDGHPLRHILLRRRLEDIRVGRGEHGEREAALTTEEEILSATFCNHLSLSLSLDSNTEIPRPSTKYQVPRPDDQGPKIQYKRPVSIIVWDTPPRSHAATPRSPREASRRLDWQRRWLE